MVRRIQQINPSKILNASAFIGGQKYQLFKNAKPFVYNTRTKSNFINTKFTIISLKKSINMITKIVSKKGLVLIHTNDQVKQRQPQHFITNQWYGGYISNYKTNTGLPQLPSFIVILPYNKKLYDLISYEVKKKKIPFCSLVQTTYQNTNPTYPLYTNIENKFVRQQFLTLFKKAIIMGLLKETLRLKKSS